MGQETTHELELVFGTDAGTDFTVTVSDCVAEPDAEGVSTVMDTIISKQVLTDNAGNLATYSRAAYHVETRKDTMFTM